MKKTNLLVLSLFLVATSFSQTIADAQKLISYRKFKSAKDMLQKMVAANGNDALAVYWLGQALVGNEDVNGAKAIYQKALQSGVTNPILFIGMAHIDLMQGGDWNSANQKFESAITTSAETKGKNKGKAPAYIYNAIGRANVIGRLAKDGSSKFGNMDYAIEKLKIVKDFDVTNTECLLYMGLAYRKMGGEFGGEAQKSYMEALQRNPNLAEANYLLGKIYQSQQSVVPMTQYFNAAIQNDASFAPVYLDYYTYYSKRDVTVAKENIEKYIQYADKDCKNDYFYADYLFQAGNFNESLAKAKALENSECNNRVPVLYAYNYDRLGDSIQAKTNIEKFLSSTTPDNVLNTDYEIAVKVLSKFSGSETKAIEYLNRLIEMETNPAQKAYYQSQIVGLSSKSGNLDLQIQAIEKAAALKGSFSERNYYDMYTAYFNAKMFDKAIEVSQKYMGAYPTSNFGFDYYVKAAGKIDTGNATGLFLEACKIQNGFMMKDTAKYKQKIVVNFYHQITYYNDVLKDYSKAIEICDEILKLVPNEAQTLKIREQLKRNADKKSGAPAKPTTPKTPATPATPKDKKTTGSTTTSKPTDKVKKK